VKDFVQYLLPREEERRMRQFVVKRVEHKFRSMFPGAETIPFGSFNTGLCLPSSDIDLVVFCELDDRTDLVLSSCSMLRTDTSLTRPGVRAITDTKVPIIKFTERYSGYHVDICFNQERNLKGPIVTKELLQRYPGTRELVMTIKYFLKLRGLHDPADGGMGSYTVLLLVVSFLQVASVRQVVELVLAEN
jgi:non-canonical poly(A) RNA polymerase PAPD5/7